MRQTLKIQIPDEKTFLMVIPLWSDHAFWAGKTSHYNHNAGRVNLYKFDPVEASGWPGNNVANPSVKFDDAAGGGFYSDNINPQKKFILNNINGSGSQTGDITISQDTWGQYNGTNTFTSLMTTSTMTNVGIVKFASGGYAGGWPSQVNTTYDATNQVYILTTSYTSGFGFDIFINGTKFLYRTTSQVTGYSASYSNASVTVTFNPYTGAMTMAPGPNVSTNAITPTTLCAGASVDVPYTATGTFGSGNIFTAQLSNAAGSFATPQAIGTLSSTTSGTISATIPTGITYGTGYRIRVVSSNPNVVGGNNGSDLTIYPPISSAIIQSPKTGTVCENAAFTVYGRVGAAGITNNDATPFSHLSAKFGYGSSNNPSAWTWVDATHNTQGASIDGTKDEYNYTIPANTLSAGTYYYGFKFKIGDCTEVLGGQNGILNNDPGVLTVLQATKITTQPTVTQTVNLYAHTTLTVTASGNASGSLSYQWYRNTSNSNVGGTAISGETNSSYVVNTYTSGTFYYYAVASTGGGSCDSLASNVATVVVNSAATSGTANWANIQSPKMETDVYIGVGINVFAQVFVPGTGGTPGPGQALGIQAWIGYSTTDTNPNLWPETQWKPAVYNGSQAHLTENNDEYWIENLGSDLPAGTYYVASRFQKGSGSPVYGGTEDTTDNVSGGIWGIGPYKSLKLNINKIVTWVPNAGATAGEWNNGSGPVITSPAIIATDLTSPSTSFSAKKLTINNGVGLTIPSGQSVTVDGELINNNGTSTIKTLVVESGANFIQNNSSIANTGNIRVKRDASVPAIQYNFWSSPVSGQDLYNFYQSGNVVAAKKVFTYNTLTDRYTVVNSGNFSKAIGYSIKGENSGNSNAVFFGAPNNGNATVGLAATGQRFNLIGNPYASNINADQFYAENETQIENTFYFWDNTGNNALSQMGSGYNTYGTNNFATYNASAEIGNPGTGTPNNASEIPNGKIVVGQGFIVQAKSGVVSPSVTFKNSMRTAGAGVFFAKQNQQKNAFWLQLISPSQLSNTTAVIYKDNAQNMLDKFDSELSSLSSDALFTFAENDSKKLSIQGRNGNQISEDVMRLGAQFFNDGQYTFALKDKQGIFANVQNIYLHDKQTNTYTNLQNENYTFTAVKGLIENRFEIVYKENAVLGNDETKTSAFQIYRDGTDFVIQSDKNLGRVEVYNMSGQLLKNFVINHQTFKINVSDLPVGMYIVKIENSGDLKTKKIIK